jgi:3-deoxy-manno-octulosonate cytidylyltransferase (CMP-KDO synthetase)
MPTDEKILAVIPARWASTRFPGKPLADIFGKPMVQWVSEQAQKANLINEVVIATDDERIYDAVLDFGGQAVMTSPNHQSGTDRVAEVVSNIECDIVVNVQGDEPLIPSENIDLVIKPLLDSGDLSVSTLMIAIHSWSEMLDPNICKVVVDNVGRALYFTRAPLPYNRDHGCMDKSKVDNKVGANQMIFGYKHIGVYAYRKSFLLKFSNMKTSRLENTEKLEQLRILENGYSIQVVETKQNSVGVDRPSDIEKIVKNIIEKK